MVLSDFLGCVRCSYNDLSIHKVLVESRVFTLFIGGSNEFMSLILDPFPQA